MNLLLLALLVAPLQDKPDERPNVLFILTDDHRPDGMGCYGNATLRTPHFDSIAAEGARLDRFYVASPLCCPSRGVFLTGLYPRQNGVLTNDGADPKPRFGTVAEMMEKAGYVTGFVGKAHLGGDPRKWGFREWPVWLPAGASPHTDPKLMVEGKAKRVEADITEIFAGAAIDWVTKRKADRWFLWLATTAPHTPYVHDPDHPYDREKIAPPPLWPDGEKLGKRDWAGYYSTISHLDEQVGRVLKALRETGQLDRTLVIVAGDNGFMQGSHGHPAKAVWFEESSRVPCLARWPAKIKAGSVVGGLASSVDFWPTLAEVAGVAKPEGLEGVSLLPLLAEGRSVRERLFAEVVPNPEREFSVKPWRMVRDDRWKYVKLEDGTEHLYDLQTDPKEAKDLAADPDSSKPLELMRKAFTDWDEKLK